MKVNGIAYLIGAGPGAPDLITVKGRECLRIADVVIYDRLASPELLQEARAGAELIYVGKSAGHHALRQEEINALIVRKAQEGKVVARLKGGDPFVFGRGGEEALALCEAGIAFEVVPGITSAIAVPAYAGIPVTQRGYTSSLSIITGHEDPGKDSSDLDWSQIAVGSGTLVFLMGVRNLPDIVTALLRNGRTPDTPAAVIQRGTEPTQQTVVGCLENIVQKAQAAGITPPAITVVGEVVNLREHLRWFDIKPLFGKRILVTRSREQASGLSARLRELGAQPVEFPTIRIVPAEDSAPLDHAIARLSSYDWIVFTSVNGVKHFMDGLARHDLDARAFATARLAAIGPVTAAELWHYALRADYVPDDYVAEAVSAGLDVQTGQRILLPRADLARPALVEELRERGCVVDEVTTYRTLPYEHTAEDVRVLFGTAFDIVTFTSSSTVRNLVAILRDILSDDWQAALRGARIACIGPITAETAQELGVQPDIVAEEYTIAGLVDAIVAAQGNHISG